MKAAYDLTKLDETIRILDRIYQHRKGGSTLKSLELYYKLLAERFHDIRKAAEEGKPWLFCSFGTPYEIYAAMDLPIVIGDVHCGVMGALLGVYEDMYAAAQVVGIRPEVCPAQKMQVGSAAKGWLPRPSAVVYNDLGMCASVGGVGPPIAQLYDIPAFFVHSPYSWGTEQATEYRAKEMGSLVTFLEKLTARKMDYDRLREVMDISCRQLELIQEINKLRVSVPCPLSIRMSNQVHWMQWLLAGSEEGVEYFECLRDDLIRMVETKQGAARGERFRILNLFPLPQNQMKIFDWAESEKGAAFFEPVYWRWLDWEPEPQKLLESVARKLYADPYPRWLGSLEDCLKMTTEEITEAGIDAAMIFFNDKCDWGGGYGRTIKDLLMERFGIPTVSLAVDLLDPAESHGIAIKERFMEFFPIITPRHRLPGEGDKAPR